MGLGEGSYKGGKRDESKKRAIAAATNQNNGKSK
jgi:hypothetical protein